MTETDEIVRLRAQLDGQANTMKKHRATWMAILKDRRGWREAARVERERHLVWEQRFEEERQRASAAEDELRAWRCCANDFYTETVWYLHKTDAHRAAIALYEELKGADS